MLKDSSKRRWTLKNGIWGAQRWRTVCKNLQESGYGRTGFWEGRHSSSRKCVIIGLGKWPRGTETRDKVSPVNHMNRKIKSGEIGSKDSVADCWWPGEQCFPVYVLVSVLFLLYYPRLHSYVCFISHFFLSAVSFQFIFSCLLQNFHMSIVLSYCGLSPCSLVYILTIKYAVCIILFCSGL